MGYRSSVLIVVLVFGVLFSMLYLSSIATTTTTISRSSNNNNNQSKEVATVIIPKGGSRQSSSEHFVPETIRVVLGLNNTVMWINKDDIINSVVADNTNYDPSFYNATYNQDNAYKVAYNNLLPNHSFEFTFTKAGEYGYHAAPHPWMQGTVIVVER